MRIEVESAANFVTDFLRKQKIYKLTLTQINLFHDALILMLQLRYNENWDVNYPNLGGYDRIILSDGEDIIYAARVARIPECALRRMIPDDMKISVNPGKVTCKLSTEPLQIVLYNAEVQTYNYMTVHYYSRPYDPIEFIGICSRNINLNL